MRLTEFIRKHLVLALSDGGHVVHPEETVVGDMQPYQRQTVAALLAGEAGGELEPSLLVKRDPSTFKDSGQIICVSTPNQHSDGFVRQMELTKKTHNAVTAVGTIHAVFIDDVYALFAEDTYDMTAQSVVEGRVKRISKKGFANGCV